MYATGDGFNLRPGAKSAENIVKHNGIALNRSPGGLRFRPVSRFRPSPPPRTLPLPPGLPLRPLNPLHDPQSSTLNPPTELYFFI